jgi:hypothetical protein
MPSLIIKHFKLKIMRTKNIFNLAICFITVAMVGCTKQSESNFAAVGGGTGTGGSTARFTIIGNYLYTVDKQNLNVFDITNAANPSLSNVVPVGFEIETIFPFKNRLFIGSTSAIHIFNIDNPALPVKLSTAISPTAMRRCDPVVAKDSVAYATLRTNGPCGGTQSILATYDIRNIETPIQKAFNFVTEPYGLGYADSTLYVCDRRGLNIYNITNGFQPLFVSNINNTEWYYDVIAQNNNLYCWVNTGLIVYNITNRRSPVLIKKII